MEVSVEKTQFPNSPLCLPSSTFSTWNIKDFLLSLCISPNTLGSIYSHVGIPGNDTDDQRAKKKAESNQPEIPLTLKRAKSIISTHIDHFAAKPEWMATT
ncbi:hypothetical protein TNCV_4964931 [Trichonephila clavipes]|nr:hypothetical protein TNCV_4964931 [Trichonephila clavipes]